MTATVPEFGGCPWPVDTACFTEDWDALDPSIQERSLAFASATLYRLTGYRVGGCPITVRPCKESCTNGPITSWFPTAWMYPHIGQSGMWVNSCGCTTDCACEAVCEITLPGPVGTIYAIMLDGVPVPPTDYRLDNGNRVVWIGDGECPWPACQDMTKPVTEPGTFGITYLNSYPVDSLGAYAAAVLAMEFAEACLGNNCRLPATVTSVTRQGVSFEVTSGTFPGGVTGIREVDAFIGIWNPGNLRQQPQVWTPDMRTTRVVRP